MRLPEDFNLDLDQLAQNLATEVFDCLLIARLGRV